MDVRREIQALIDCGLRFSIEVTGPAVLIWVGNYLGDRAAAAKVASIEQAVQWLQTHRWQLAANPA